MARRGNWIPVVAGIIKQNNKILLGQRPEEKSLPGVWEFPGGKIEFGESPESALARELNEELAIDAEVGALRFAATHSYGEVGILLLFYDIPFWKGQPKAVHHTDLRWVDPAELDTLELPDANKKVLPHIQQVLS